MNVVNVLPKFSAAEYALRKEEVGNSLYDIIKKYTALPDSGTGCIIHTVQAS